jgi:hypothetical protein
MKNAGNRKRPANEPVIRSGVIAANIIWKIANTYPGIVGANIIHSPELLVYYISHNFTKLPFLKLISSGKVAGLPIIPATVSPYVKLNPIRFHITDNTRIPEIT